MSKPLATVTGIYRSYRVIKYYDWYVIETKPSDSKKKFSDFDYRGAEWQCLSGALQVIAEAEKVTEENRAEELAAESAKRIQAITGG